MGSFYVTTPIYYVNAAPHLGHAYTTIARRRHGAPYRQRGDDVFFLTGTDEHGEPVADAAEAQGLSPASWPTATPSASRRWRRCWRSTNDFFIRTSDPSTSAGCRRCCSASTTTASSHKGLYEGWYCPAVRTSRSENEIEEGNRCPIHHIELERHSEENYFFALSRLPGALEELYAAQPDFVAPRSRYNEALAFIKSGLQDVSLSRANLTWGVPVPWDDQHVFYVWFDALLNYYTALGFAREGEDLTERFWPASYHLIGKDILKFHTVFWPAMLMAADLPLPEHIYVHGYLLMDGEKMSKSLGNVLDPFAVIDRFGTDALRYYLLRDVSFGQDGSVSTEAFEGRYESELANDFGNLASRTLAMVVRYRDGELPPGDLEDGLTADFAGLDDRVAELVDRADLTAALEEIWTRVRRLNRYVEEQAPWTLAKDEARAADLDRVLRSLVEGLRVVGVLLAPWIPGASEKLLTALGAPGDDYASARYGAGAVARVEKIAPLFPKHDPVA